MLLTSSILLDFIILLTTGIYFLYRYTSKKHKYWAERGVYSPKTQPIFGHFFNVAMMKTTLAEWLKDYYDRTDKPYFGVYVFDDPYFIFKDAQLVKNVLIRDFSYFVDRNIAAPEHSPLCSNMMFLQKSPEWRDSRVKLSVAYTSGKLRGMMKLITKSKDELSMYLKQRPGAIIEAKELATRYATDVISLCAFGINSHCFDDKPSIFRDFGRKCFDFSLRNALSQTVYFFKPSWVPTFKLEFMPKDAMTYFAEAFQTVMKTRKDDERVNDLIDILNDMKKNRELTEEDNDLLIGAAIQFFLAGYETTSSVISFTLYEMAKNPHMQTRLRTEIQTQIKKHGELSYDAVQEMTYLHMCIQETLRLYPILPFLERKCNTDYPIPDSDYTIEKGTPVLIPTYGLQMDEKHFPEPHIYNPERFQDKFDNSAGVFYLPFGEGPRGCIGERFGRLGTKMAIIAIISTCEVAKCKGTPDPVRFEPKSFLLQSKVGLPLQFNSLPN